MADWIISQMPPHQIYVEPFGGAASVLMAKNRSRTEVYNDAWGTVVNVFRVLRDREKGDELSRRLRLTPFSRAEFEAAATMPPGADDVELARLTIVRAQGAYRVKTHGRPTGFRSRTFAQHTNEARSWAAYPNEIEWFIDRLQGVLIECLPALAIITRFDTPETLFYCDPPYVKAVAGRDASRVYEHSMSDEDHKTLASLLHSIKGMAIVSGYASDLYDQELYPDWKRVETRSRVSARGNRVEVLWISPNCWEYQTRMPLGDWS
jgi:DNA adenine methylase